MKYRPELLFGGLLLLAVAGTLCLIDNNHTSAASVFAIIGVGNVLADIALRLGPRP